MWTRLPYFGRLARVGRPALLTSVLVLAGCEGVIGELGGSSDGPGGGGRSPGGVDDPDDDNNDNNKGNDRPRVCIPGIPATTQVRRMLNRQYDSVVADLLDVTTLSSADNQPPSTLLVPDYAGSLTEIAWNGYLLAARSIAAQVMEGPNRSRFLECDPAAPNCLSDTIRAFGRKAFRRPLTENEVASFERLIHDVNPPGAPNEVAQTILYAFLASPSFIMVPELSQETEGDAIKLSQHEVAARLSFLIWDSMPDETLNAAADNGELGTPGQILEHARRMVRVREKSGPVVTAMHRYYAGIYEGSHWAQLDHDPVRYPNYSRAAAQPMMAEIDAFFEEVAFGTGSFADIFLSNVGFVNEVTAPLYGLDAAGFGPELTRVPLEPTQRPGFLTRVGFLSSFSAYSTTSPILRGAYISERIVGVNIPSPPPGATDSPVPEGVYTTNREVIEALTGQSVCVDCHAPYINPPGFVLESYDSVGSFQTVDPLGGPIDSTADVYFGEDNTQTITSPTELMTKLAASDDVRRRYAELLVSFATGRAPNSNDACTVDQLALELTADGYTALDLLADLTRADSFRLRTVGN